MQEFITQYAKIENPTFEMVLFTFLVSFICSTIIALTYYFTSPNSLKNSNFIQALILSTLIANMILQSIGDNVASGLGILGALTIINFRTSFRNPRDIIFMFAALGVGIACGSFVFLIAITGTLFFCFIAFALKFTPFDLGNHTTWNIRLKFTDQSQVTETEKILNTYCMKYNFDGIRNDKVGEIIVHERSYDIVLKEDSHKDNLLRELEAAGVQIFRFNIQQNTSTNE
jgi:uncharacterized membrane protein YhiD involved in acid resistance